MFSLDRWMEVLDTLRRNKLRTTLTAVSVAWGIFVLVFLLGMGNGFSNAIRANFAREAMNGVFFRAGKTSEAFGGYDIGRRLVFDTTDYARTIDVPSVRHASAEHNIQSTGVFLTKFGTKAQPFDVQAVYPNHIYLEQHTLVAGRFLTEPDISQRRKSAVIGQTAAQYLFGGGASGADRTDSGPGGGGGGGKPSAGDGGDSSSGAGRNPIGQWITVANVPFQVVGVFTDPGGADAERRVYVPATTAQLAWNGADRLGSLELDLGTADAKQSQAVIDRVVADLAERHKFDPHDKQAVRVRNNIEGAQRFNMMFVVIALFVVVIGLGTLAAGVVGVSNIMMIAVKERTKEIGVRKALGATPWSIVGMIVQEAVFITGIAGLLGLAAGVGLLGLMADMQNPIMRSPSIPLSTGIAAAAFLVVAGALAGFFPARAAARVNPIHALRDQ